MMTRIKGGLKPGDTILSIDSFDITEKQDLANMLKAHINGNPYIFTIEIYDIERTIKINCNEEEVESTQETIIIESEPTEKQAQSKSKSSKEKIGVTISSLLNGKYIITSVEENSPAEHAGIQTGDIVISIDGIEIHEDWDLQTVLLRHNAGNPYTYLIKRNGEEKKLIISMEFE
ncbi:PDZ domain-containing protein [Hungatella hathewayi]|uniref:PDZ domain-containing protein n=1 Tax=Hungatella hathewayi TaxID=154046 RepID=UPI00356B52D3